MTHSHNFSALACLAKDKHQRLFIHIQGPQSQALNQAAIVAAEIALHGDNGLNHYCLSETQEFSASALADMPNMHCLATSQAQNKMRQLLGLDCGVLIINAYSGFNPNILGLSSGCISAGAALIIISPETQEWPVFNDPDYKRLRAGTSEDKSIAGHYLQRISQRLQQQPLIIRGLIQTGEISWENQQAVVEYLKSQSDKVAYFAHALDDQAEVVADICHVLNGHAKRPLILEADRGRGKSTAMGMAAARLLLQAKQPLHIAVTAPQRRAVDTLFYQAHKALITLLGHDEGVVFEDSSLSFQGSCLQFYAVDQLQQAASLTKPVSLLLVDEAAAIPSLLLTGLLTQYTRLVFATTVYGYEGNGRGFSLRFKPLIKARMPQYKERSLQHPIRWSQNDIIEETVNDLLLLDAERNSWHTVIANEQVDLTDIQYAQYSQQDLVDNPELLQSIFALLVAAHYQTSGDDLRVLLDHTDVQIMTLMFNEKVIAVVLLMLEGGFCEADQQTLLTQHRRFRGHLLPQQCFNLGYEQALQYRFARVMRIAVMPSLQASGLGSKLLSMVEKKLTQSSSADFYGASFAAEPDVVRFWQNNDFELVTLGSRKDSSTGLFTLTVMKCLNENSPALNLQETLNKQWQENLSYQLLTQHNAIQVSLLPLLYKNYVTEYALHDYDQLQHYCQQRRGFEVVQAAMHRFIQYIVATNASQQWLAEVDEDKIELLLEALLLNRSWQELARHYHYSGRKAIEEALRSTLQPLLLAVKPD